MTGMLRNPRGLIGALIASWFNRPIAILLGGIGLVAGGLGGYVGGAFGGNNTADSWVHDIPILDPERATSTKTASFTGNS